MDTNGGTGAVGNFNWIAAAAATTGGGTSSTPYGGTPAPLPGTIQAENFDEGARGIAYVDTTAENSGGQYRTTAVDVEASADTGGGYNVGWASAGEWLNYTVNVTTAGTYGLDVRVASNGAGGTFHVEVNGVDKTGPLTVPNTGGWQTWTTVRKSGVSLGAGSQVWRLVMDTNGGTGAVGNFNWIAAAAATSGGGTTSTPYGGTPAALPGTIQAENFDEGASGTAYVDTTAVNSGGEYRTTGVDVEASSDTGGGYDVGYAFAGEWLNYTVNVGTAGTYDLDVRVASSGAGGTFHVEVNGVDKTGPLTVPNTGGWQTWTTVRKSALSVSAGSQVWRLVMDTNGGTTAVGNFNWMRLSPVSSASGFTILRGPFLQQITENSAIVVWTTREPGAAEVRYATSGAPRSAQAQTRLYTAGETGIGYDFYQHEARIAGLSASSAYTYDLFMAGTDITTGQDVFTTAPLSGTGTVRFIAFGDSGVGSTAQRQLAARMGADSFDLALHTGDVAYGDASGIGGPGQAQYSDWVFDVYGSWLRSHPFFPSIGNHDDEVGAAQAYRDAFVLPENGATAAYPDHAERYYSFDYGPVHFVVLDTELAFLDTARRQAQLAWLDADLAATSQPWRVAYFHRPPYSAGGEHGSALDVRDAFVPIFEKRRVQLAISGHEHDYERTFPLRSYTAQGGAVTYIVTGGGGAPLYPAGTASWTAASASVYHYMRGSVGNCVLKLDAVGLDGVVFDTYSIDRCATTAAASFTPDTEHNADMASAAALLPGSIIAARGRAEAVREVASTTMAHPFSAALPTHGRNDVVSAGVVAAALMTLTCGLAFTQRRGTAAVISRIQPR
jgi:hypothetical protein